jgi:hypothetical protein
MSLTATAPASTHAVTFDETAAHVFACPHCVSSSVGMAPPIATSHQEGQTRVDTLTIPLYCQTCEAEWEIELVASSRDRGLRPIDLVARIVKGA